MSNILSKHANNLNIFSDCEKMDVVDIAKDEELEEKLLYETLCALKLDGANLKASAEKINDSKKKV